MNTTNDRELLCTLLEQHEKHTMPRILDIRQKVENGEKLNDVELNFLHDVFADIQRIEPMIHRHPEYQVLFSRTVDLCKDISSRAAENEDRP